MSRCSKMSELTLFDVAEVALYKRRLSYVGSSSNSLVKQSGKKSPNRVNTSNNVLIQEKKKEEDKFNGKLYIVNLFILLKIYYIY